jgi:hypothetical protein
MVKPPMSDSMISIRHHLSSLKCMPEYKYNSKPSQLGLQAPDPTFPIALRAQLLLGPQSILDLEF